MPDLIQMCLSGFPGNVSFSSPQIADLLGSNSDEDNSDDNDDDDSEDSNHSYRISDFRSESSDPEYSK